MPGDLERLLCSVQEPDHLFLGQESSAFCTCILPFRLSLYGLSKNEKHQNFLFLLVLVVPPMQEMLGWLHGQSSQTGRTTRTHAQTTHRHGFIVVFLSGIYIDWSLQFAYLSPISPSWEPGFSYQLNQRFFLPHPLMKCYLICRIQRFSPQARRCIDRGRIRQGSQRDFRCLRNRNILFYILSRYNAENNM